MVRAILGLPAIYGALTIFPIATIAKGSFGKSAGVVAAWLIAFHASSRISFNMGIGRPRRACHAVYFNGIHVLVQGNSTFR